VLTISSNIEFKISIHQRNTNKKSSNYLI